MTIDHCNRRRQIFTARRVVFSIFYQLTKQDYLNTHTHTHTPTHTFTLWQDEMVVNGKKLLISKKRSEGEKTNTVLKQV